MSTSHEPKSCDGCKWRLEREEQSVAYGEDIGGPVCGKGQGPLFLPTIGLRQNETLRTVKACERWSDDRFAHEVTDLDSISGATVMMPDIKSIESSVHSPIVRSCLQCKNFIPPETMVDNGLWNIGVCSVRGITVGKRDVVKVSDACTMASLGMRDETALSRMQLVPEYTMSTIGVLVSAADFASEAKVKYLEPTTYPSDREVSDEDKAVGIRAWRRISNPDDSGNHDVDAFLPIFDLDFFSEEEQAAIPRTGDDEHPEEYVDHMGLAYKAAVLWLHLEETPALWGVAGTGKTEFYRHMAWLMVMPFNRISVTASTEVEDLAGKMHYEPTRGTYFEYGRIPNAWKKPGVICLDEPNVGPPDVWQFIRPLTDNSKQLVLDMNNGERISRHPHAFLGLAMNPAWDVRNSGTSTLADADGSRLMHIYVELPTESVERNIIADRCRIDGFDIPEEMLTMVMSVAKELRSLCEADTLPITWGIRPQIKVARALRWFKPSAAYRLATADYLEPEQQQIIMDVVKAHAASPFSKPPKPITGDRTPRARSAALPPVGRTHTPTPPPGLRPPIAPYHGPTSSTTEALPL